MKAAKQKPETLNRNCVEKTPMLLLLLVVQWLVGSQASVVLWLLKHRHNVMLMTPLVAWQHT